jgi:hypothetical protein
MNRFPALCRPAWLDNFLVVAAVIPALIALSMAIVPSSVLNAWAMHLGHGDDVTPERITRLRNAGCALVAAHFFMAIILAKWGTPRARKVLEKTCDELSSAQPVSGVRQLIMASLESGWLHAAVLIAVFGIGCLIRLAYLQVPMDYDEAHSFLSYARRPLYQGLLEYNSTNNHLLNTLLMHAGFTAFGPVEWALRLHVFVAGLGLIAAVYLFGRYCVGPDAGLMASAFAATSYLMVNYSVNARGYIWTASMATLMAVAFWRIARSDNPLASDWLGAGFSAILGLFALPTMNYPIAGCVVWLAAQCLRGKGDRGKLVPAFAWVLLVGLAAVWLYAPGFIYHGFAAWRHQFVQPQEFSAWLVRAPIGWFLALRSWSEGPVPWPIAAGFAVLGVPTLWMLDRKSLGLILSIFGVTAVCMMIQRVSPPPRVMSFLAPFFSVLFAAGVLALAKLIALPQSTAERDKAKQTASRLCSCLALTVCAWGYFGVKKQPLPGGLRPTFLVEDVAKGWQSVGLLGPSRPTQLWRLDVKEAVDKVRGEFQPGDRILVGLPADLPFHFYAEQSGWHPTIGGRPQAGERVFLVIRAGDLPEMALRDNFTLRTEPFEAYPQKWDLIASGDLAIWFAVQPGRDTKSTDQ